MMKRVSGWAVCALGAMLAGGCCNCLKPAEKTDAALPAPISMAEQLQRLNARATAIPRFLARAEGGGVEVGYLDDKGVEKHKAVDGSLALEQRYDAHSANVLLTARYLGQEVLQAGNNAQVWWILQGAGGGQDAVAQMGRVTDGSEGEPLGAEGVGKFVPRTDLVPNLLGITELSPTPGQVIAMRVDDVQGVNELLIERVREDGTAWIEREVVVDRRTGEVRAVELYAPSGELLLRSTLESYAAVEDERTNGAGPGGVQMPRRVEIDSPAQHFRLLLRFARFRIPERMPEGEFDVPDWKDLGVKPEVVGNGQ